MREWTTADIERMARLRDEGMEWNEVGDEFGVSAGAARKAFARRKHTRRQPDARTAQPPPPPPDWTDWRKPGRVDWRDWHRAWEQANDLHKVIDPTQEYLTIDFSGLDRPIAIVSASDLHMGGGYTDHGAIRETIEYILATDYLYLGVTGDTIEGFIPGMKPAETIEQQPSSVKAQIAALDSLVEELGQAGKLLWMTWGDHDAKWFEQAIGINVIKNAVHDRVPYFTGRGVIKLLLAEQRYFICVNHSERFASQWNTVHPARRQYERFFPADVNIVGHRHKPAFMMDHHYSELRQAGIDLGGKHWMVQNGTFKTGPDPYTIRSWNRGIIGCPTMVFHHETHDVDLFEGPRKAVAFLRGLGLAA